MLNPSVGWPGLRRELLGLEMSKTVQKPEVISSITSIIVQKLQKYPQCKIGVKIAGEDIDSKNNKTYTKGTFFLYIISNLWTKLYYKIA